MTKYYSIRVVIAESRDEAIEKVENNEFEETDSLCDKVLTITELETELIKKQE